MAEPLAQDQQYAFYRKHHKLREWAWAAHFAHLDRAERAGLRMHLQDPSCDMGRGDIAAGEMRRRMIEALDSLDLIEDPKPSRAVCGQVQALLARVARG